MSDVVDADELLRRIRRGRDRAAEEERVWRDRGQSLTATDPDQAREAFERARAYEVVQGVLAEIVSPGSLPPAEAGLVEPGVRRVT